MYCWEDVVRSNALEALREAVALGLASDGERHEAHDPQHQAPNREAMSGSIANLIQRIIGKERPRQVDQVVGEAAATAVAEIEQQLPQQEKSVMEVFISTVEEMLRGYLDETRLQELQDAVQDLYEQAELYCKAPPYSPQQAEILTRLMTYITSELQPRIFSNEAASSSEDVYKVAPAKVLPYLVAVGTLHLAALRERLVYGKQLYGDEITYEDAQKYQAELRQAVHQYNTVADAAYSFIQAWRQSHFSFSENHVNQKPPHKNAAITYRYVYTASDSFSGWSYESSYSTTVLWAFRTVTGDPKAEQKVQQALQNHRQEAAKQLGECLAQALAPLRLWGGSAMQGRQGTLLHSDRCDMATQPEGAGSRRCFQEATSSSSVTTAAAAVAAMSPGGNHGDVTAAASGSLEEADDATHPSEGIDGVSVSVSLDGDVSGVLGGVSSPELVSAPSAEAPLPECQLARAATGSDSAATGELFASAATGATGAGATAAAAADDDNSSGGADATAAGLGSYASGSDLRYNDASAANAGGSRPDESGDEAVDKPTCTAAVSDPVAVQNDREDTSAAEGQGDVHKAIGWEDYFPCTFKVAITVAFGAITVVQLYRLARQNHML